MIVLAVGGAETIAKSTVDPDRVILIEAGDAFETARHLGEAMTRFATRPPRATGPCSTAPRQPRRCAKSSTGPTEWESDPVAQADASGGLIQHRPGQATACG